MGAYMEDNVCATREGLIRSPRPWALLLVGPPGTGKTSMALALSEDLPATLSHVTSQKCDVATLDKLAEKFIYYPAEATGGSPSWTRQIK